MTYVDPDLLGGITIEKGPTLNPSGSGGIGGVADMRTINAGDVLQEGQKYGARVRLGTNTNSSSPPPLDTSAGYQLSTTPVTTSTPNLSASRCRPAHSIQRRRRLSHRGRTMARQL